MITPPSFSYTAITFSNGTIVPDATTSTGWRYKIAVKDHLGNTRAVISDLNDDGVLDLESSTDPSELLSIHNYMPFGMEMLGPWMQSHPASMDYLYNSKEFNFRGSLGWYDYGARWYDPTIGRWNAVDPLADVPHSISMTPYHYVANNPMRNIDPDGRDWLSATDEEMAERLQRLMNRRITQIERHTARLERRLERAASSGNERRMNRIQNNIENNTEQIKELEAGIVELDHLGDSEDFVFTFTRVSGPKHHVRLLDNPNDDRPLISLEYSSRPIAAHEARHAHQFVTGGKERQRMRFNEENLLVFRTKAAQAVGETRAYRLQYAIRKNSLPISAPNSITGVTPEWISLFPGNPYGF